MAVSFNGGGNQSIRRKPETCCQSLTNLTQITHDTVRLRSMVFNATFNNISVISWLSVLMVEETRVSGENHRPVASH
jgi:hypothetical protein